METTTTKKSIGSTSQGNFKDQVRSCDNNNATFAKSVYNLQKALSHALVHLIL